MRLFKPGMSEDKPDATGCVTANVDIQRQSRQSSDIKIVIVCADSGATLFKASYSTDKSEIASFSIAKRIIDVFCEAGDYIPEINSTGAQLPGVSTVKRSSRW